ncbi:hypothetical protein [Fundidesulfovibrio butyratiphilus]
MKYILFGACLLVCSAFLSACGIKEATVTDNKAIEVPDGKETKAIALRKVIVKLPHGTEIGNLKAGLGCINYGRMAWKSGKVNIGDEEFTTVRKYASCWRTEQSLKAECSSPIRVKTWVW